MRFLWAAAAVAMAAGTALSQPLGDAELRKEAGNYFLKKRQYEQARDQYLAALKAEPDYADAHYNLGVVYFFRLQDHRRALYHLVRYAHLKQDAPDLPQVRSLTLQALEKIEGEEREAYGRALEKGTVEALEAFLAEHPGSPYAGDAREKIRVLTEVRERTLLLDRERNAAYTEALAAGSPEALDAFLAAHPDAPQAAEVRRVRALWIERRTEDERALASALAAGTPEALETFLGSRPGSPLAPRAQAALDRLRSSEQAYLIASQARSIAALEVFLATYGGTPRQTDAENLLRTLRDAEAREAVHGADAQAPSAGAAPPAAAAPAAPPAAPQPDESAVPSAEQDRGTGDEPAVPRAKRATLDRYRQILQAD